MTTYLTNEQVHHSLNHLTVCKKHKNIFVHYTSTEINTHTVYLLLALSAGAAEYTDCISAQGLVGWVLWHINLCRLFNGDSIFMKIVFFQTIQFSISTQFKCKYSLIVKTFLFLAIQFSQAVLIQLIQFSISTDFVYT